MFVPGAAQVRYADGMKDPEFEAAVEAARNYVMTPAEREAQRRSFAFGNANIENPDVTREVIDRAARRLSRATKSA